MFEGKFECSCPIEIINDDTYPFHSCGDYVVDPTGYAGILSDRVEEWESRPGPWPKQID